MTGTTEQAPESGVKAPTAGTSSANGAADAHRPPQAEQPVGTWTESWPTHST